MSKHATGPKREHGPSSITVEQIRAGLVHVTSDTHFGHAGIVNHALRPGFVYDGDNDTEVHERLIAAELAKLPEGHRLLHLGDVAWNRRGINVMLDAGLDKLDVEIVEGNHDNSGQRRDLTKKLGWKFVDPISVEWTVSVRDRKTGETVEHTRLVIISHYAIRADKLPEGAVCLHGHQHGSNSRYTDHRHREISPEVSGYRTLPLAAQLDNLVMQAVGEGAGQVDPQEADVVRLALANRLS
jgi:calcineurin-like phosphoesterase family protein